MEIKLKNKHNKQVMSTIGYVNTFIQELLGGSIEQGAVKELHYIVHEVSKSYVIVKIFVIIRHREVIAANYTGNLLSSPSARITQYNDFKDFLRVLHFFSLQQKLAAISLRSTGLEIRIKSGRLQICDAHVYAIPKKGIKRDNNRLNIYVQPEAVTVQDWTYHGTMKTISVLKDETFPKYSSKLRITVNIKGVWYFQRRIRERGKIIGVKNVKNYCTFSDSIGNVDRMGLQIWAKLCNAAYNLYNDQDPTPNIENILKLSNIIPVKSIFDVNTREELIGIKVKIPFINVNTNKIIDSFLKTTSSKVYVTTRFKNTIALLIKILLIWPEKSIVRHLTYLIDLHKMLRLKDIPLFNERVITLYTKLSQEIKYYKGDLIQPDIYKSILRIEFHMMLVITGEAFENPSMNKQNYEHILKDTLRMAHRLNYQLIYPNLTPTAINSYHDRLTKDTRLLDIGDVIPNTKFYKHVIATLSESKDYTIVLINSGKLLAEESAVQRHCVHNYAGDITNGRCIIFSTYFKGKRWTLEVKERQHHFVDPDKRGGISKKEYYISQFKGFLNESAPDELYELIGKSLEIASIRTNQVQPFKLSSDYKELKVAVS